MFAMSRLAVNTTGAPAGDGMPSGMPQVHDGCGMSVLLANDDDGVVGTALSVSPVLLGPASGVLAGVCASLCGGLVPASSGLPPSALGLTPASSLVLPASV